jgi:hypothetical protein
MYRVCIIIKIQFAPHWDHNLCHDKRQSICVHNCRLLRESCEHKYNLWAKCKVSWYCCRWHNVGLSQVQDWFGAVFWLCYAEKMLDGVVSMLTAFWIGVWYTYTGLDCSCTQTVSPRTTESDRSSPISPVRVHWNSAINWRCAVGPSTVMACHEGSGFSGCHAGLTTVVPRLRIINTSYPRVGKSYAPLTYF